jgi:outer membrane protein TolC
MQRIILTLFFTCSMLGSLAHAAEPKPTDLSPIKVLDLKTAQAVALADNPNMAAAQSRIEQARARVRQAAASWWPSLDLSGSGSRQRLSDTNYQYNKLLANTLMPGASMDQTNENYSAGLQATWVLFDGFYRTFKEQQAAYDEQANAAALVDSQRLLVNSVAEAFLNAQLAQTYIDIARADETFYNRQLEDAQNRYDVGAGPWGDILNIKVQLNSAKTSRIRSQREFEAAKYGLAGLMGIAASALPEHIRLESLDKDSPTPLPKAKIDTLIEEALAMRPDIRQLTMQLKQAEAAGGMAKAPFYPTVQLAGALEGSKEGDMGLSSEDFGNVVGVNMSWNLYAGGADKARLVESEQVKREVVYTLAGLRNSVASEIRQYMAMLKAAEEQVRLQRETVKLVQENRDLAQNEYEAGEASLVRLNEAQRDLTATYGRLAQALVSFQLQEQRLLAATGRNLADLKHVVKK